MLIFKTCTPSPIIILVNKSTSRSNISIYMLNKSQEFPSKKPITLLCCFWFQIGLIFFVNSHVHSQFYSCIWGCNQGKIKTEISIIFSERDGGGREGGREGEREERESIFYPVVFGFKM